MKYIVVLFLIMNMAHATHFETGSDIPTLELINEVMKIYVENIKNKPDNTEVIVEGHTDSRGNTKSNLVLSKKRAVAVANILKKLGVKNIKTFGLGESQLLDKRKSLEAHSNNRRVVIIVGNDKVIINEKKCKPLVKTKVITRTIIKRHKHIISGELLSSANGELKTSSGQSTSTIRSRHKAGVGLIYQNNIYKDLYLGGRVDTNGGVGVTLGIGF